MGKETVRVVLNLRTSGTMAQRLKPLMPTLDEAIQAGISHEEILLQLKSHGLEVPLTTFRSYLYRYRKAKQG